MPATCRQSRNTRILGGSCLIVGLFALGGCSYLEALHSPTGSDDRVQLRWEDGPLYLYRWELEEYTCANDSTLQCAVDGIKYSCRCPRYATCHDLQC